MNTKRKWTDLSIDEPYGESSSQNSKEEKLQTKKIASVKVTEKSLVDWQLMIRFERDQENESPFLSSTCDYGYEDGW